MPNPLGGNQYGDALVPYGQAKQMKELVREAPLSGAPTSGRAVNSPRRAKQQAQRQPKPQAAPGGEPMLPPAQPQVNPQAVSAQVWQQIAQQPWAQSEPVIQQLAAQAQNGG